MYSDLLDLDGTAKLSPCAQEHIAISQRVSQRVSQSFFANDIAARPLLLRLVGKSLPLPFPACIKKSPDDGLPVCDAWIVVPLFLNSLIALFCFLSRLCS